RSGPGGATARLCRSPSRGRPRELARGGTAGRRSVGATLAIRLGWAGIIVDAVVGVVALTAVVGARLRLGLGGAGGRAAGVVAVVGPREHPPGDAQQEHDRQHGSPDDRCPSDGFAVLVHQIPAPSYLTWNIP